MFFCCIFFTLLLLSASSPVLNYRQASKLITSKSESDLQILTMISSEKMSSPDGDNTLLHIAAIYGRVEALKMLLSVLNDESTSIGSLESPRKPDAINREILKSSINTESPNKPNIDNESPIKPTFYETSSKRNSSSPTFAMFRSRSSSQSRSPSQNPSPLLDSFDGSGFTPLIGAIAMGHTQVVALLLQAGASPNLPDRKASTKSGFKGLSPLQWSLKYRRTDIVKLLRATGAIDFTYRTTRKGRNFWHYAARYVKDRDVLTILPPIGLLDSDYFGITPLQHAQAHKNTTFISLFQSSPMSEETRSACIMS